ncbi:alpha-1,2-fucosyltransferase [Candidatus Pacearchaeota archaeon]|nr:alpha-1,2-fucosyltransferase [Candidatus Pacearchaeota archaeon]
MIIVEIGRGLGNAMYVYSAALALAKHHKTELKIDASYVNCWPRLEKYGGDWEYSFGKFNVSAKRATKKEIRQHIFKTNFRLVDKFLRKKKLFQKRVYTHGTYNPREELFKLPNDIYLWGYFGHPKYFDHIKNDLRHEFELKDDAKQKILPLINKLKSEESVAIHVRRGDLIRIGALLLTKEYYAKAVSMIKKKVRNPKFYVFSDEPEWCKKNFDFDVSIEYIEGNKGYEDFELIKSCKHKILANSALSWWAGYLSDIKNAIIISPRPFTHWISLAKQAEEIIPRKWIKIDVT